MKVRIIGTEVVLQRDADDRHVVDHIQDVHLGMGVGGPRLGGAVKQRLDEGLLMVAFSWKAGRIIAPSPFAQAST